MLESGGESEATEAAVMKIGRVPAALEVPNANVGSTRRAIAEKSTRRAICCRTFQV